MPVISNKTQSIPEPNLLNKPTHADPINPSHYRDHPSGVECITITQHENFCIGNAIKYAGGAEVSLVRGDGELLILVRDQGPGIAPGDVPHVFDRFYRADQASRTTKGAGLGLYLSRAVIEAHGGRIWVDPKPGEGARICFSLPREDE